MLKLLTACLLCLAFIVGACGDDDDDDPADDASEEETASETVDTQSTPNAGDDPCPGEDQPGSGDIAEAGDTVTVNYCGTLDDGTLFDEGTFDFEVASGAVVPGFDAAVTGMEVGERKTVTIPSAEAYGERDEANVIEVPLVQFGGVTPEVGDSLQGGAVVLDVTGDTVTVDTNHPLAGQDLTFQIELVAIAA
ncbi:MAG: hypothetical protein GEU28_04125 [Dehalococcoidia bacterium]|nr:hypothetical protein [Dehalococcoidia bacterium]